MTPILTQSLAGLLRKSLLLGSALFSIAAFSPAQAQVTSNLVQSGNWNVVENWDANGIPSGTDAQAVIANDLEATINTDVGAVYRIGVGDSTAGTLNVATGGTVSLDGNHLVVGNRTTGTVNITGGTVQRAATTGNRNLLIGHGNNNTGGTGIVNLISGTINLNSVVLGNQGGITTEDYSKGYLNIEGGSLTATALNFGGTSGTNNHFFGQMTVKGNAATIQINGQVNIWNAKSILAFEIGTDGVSTITANNNITLNGILDLSVLSGADILPPSVILLETASNRTITGDFVSINWGNLTGDLVIDQALKQVRVDNLAFIPEPGEIALAMGAVVAIGTVALRRRKRS